MSSYNASAKNASFWNESSSRATKTIHGIITFIVFVFAEVKGGAEITLESFARATRDFVLPIFIRVGLRFASRE